jgi:hypothetical protein
VKEDYVGRACGTLGGVHTELLWETLKQINNREEPGVHGRIILKIILGKYDLGMWTGLIWLRIEASAGPLLTWWES